MMVQDLDNHDKKSFWHQGKIIYSNNIIDYPPGTTIRFDNRKAESVFHNNSQHNLKFIDVNNIK